MPCVDLERTALDFALSELLSPESKEIVLVCLAIKHGILMKDSDRVSRQRVDAAMHQLFGSGAGLVMAQFDKRLSELART